MFYCMIQKIPDFIRLYSFSMALFFHLSPIEKLQEMRDLVHLLLRACDTGCTSYSF
jgi:hypothetical protein